MSQKRKEIRGRQEIKLLIDSFYRQVKIDPLIGVFFTETASVDWEKHLPKMYDFWESTLFHTQKYKGNPIIKHLDLHNKKAIKSEHFQRWIELFCKTVDENFEGETANTAKARAHSIATIIQFKIHHKYTLSKS